MCSFKNALKQCDSICGVCGAFTVGDGSAEDF